MYEERGFGRFAGPAAGAREISWFGYDWRAQEAELNRLDHRTTRLGGADLHHVVYPSNHSGSVQARDARGSYRIRPVRRLTR